MSKPGIPKGTRDFSPQEVKNRQFIVETIKKHFENYGFQPVETPSMEKLSTLTGKYGEEGDRLIFKILNSGDYLKKVPDEIYQEKNSRKLTPYISEKALRYDLTVPLARFVVQHAHELTFPFKRYQIQPVWRADRPQKGRYREFWQCDADVVGSSSLLSDAEFVLLYDDVFTELNIPVRIHFNNRKILMGLAEVFGFTEKFNDFAVALDKLDKIGLEGVKKEWEKMHLPGNALEKLIDFFEHFTEQSDIEALKKLLQPSATGTKGVEEIEKVIGYVEDSGLQTAELKIDLSLARGLDYYTGSIFEVKAKKMEIGSIGGGGRYDDLTGVFGMKNMPGVGISFGLDRIYWVLEKSGKLPYSHAPSVKVLLVNFGVDDEKYAWQLLKELRKNQIPAEIYPQAVKLKKQFQYADKKKIPFVVIAGEEERQNSVYTLKHMEDGVQEKLSEEQLIERLKS